MEFNSIDIKISYIVVAIDKNLSNINKSYIKLLLTSDNEIPYVKISSIDNIQHPFDILKKLHDEYIEYSFEFPYKQIGGIRFIDNICEITYTTTVNYVPRMNKKGRLFSLEELQEREIRIEDYYGEIFTKSGPNIYRETSIPSSMVR